DLRAAKIFVSVLGDDAQWKASMAALESARGFVRNWLRQHLDLRVTPELDFRPDHSLEHAARIKSILKQVRASGSLLAPRELRPRRARRLRERLRPLARVPADGLLHASGRGRARHPAGHLLSPSAPG